jgi:hypothetical protein
MTLSGCRIHAGAGRAGTVLVPAILAVIILAPTACADSAESTLDTLLLSKKLSEQRVAFETIAASPDKYVPLVRGRLMTLAENPPETRSLTIDRLLYLAAMLKDKSLAPPMEALWRNDGFIPGYCIYDCPIVFALIVYGVSDLWTPPEKMDKTRSRYHDLYEGIRIASGISLDPTPRNHRAFGPGIDSQLAEAEEESEKELIEQAGPGNGEGKKRFAAMLQLSYTVSGSENLKEFYWLAVQEGKQDGGYEPRHAVYRTIYRAEKARRMGR